MAGDHEGRALQARLRQRFAEFLHRLRRVLADVGRVVVEADFEIDLRLGRGDLRDLLALAERKRPRLAVAQAVDELALFGLGHVIDLLLPSRQAAGQRLRLQGLGDLIGRDNFTGQRQPCRHRQRGAERNGRNSGKSGNAGHGLGPSCYTCEVRMLAF